MTVAGKKEARRKKKRFFAESGGRSG